MNRKSNNFNSLWLLAVSLVLGFTLLSLNPYYSSSQSKLELQIHDYLEDQSFFLKGDTRADFIAYLVATAKDYEFDPLLILAIMKVESSFKPGAESNRGACGLLQLKLVAAKEVSNVFDTRLVARHELFDPFVNVKVGIQYLSFLRNHLGDNVVRMLSAYNMGPTRVKSSGIVSSGYSSKVMRAYRDLLKEFS
ncbi:MAG: hypothetical protein A2W61_04900 [Deltaproteobacteria bacterium RIFCSPLOWO2_01_44_7]|nr:MAG: hypothetical protein A2712_08760 [Deltaproteobacteria bacterium RIFCSPHIGHO2_01_FULL_43_49]OGQ14572.1 MAG: hypothetical protein A3D22_08240 [Deltaproteobacteria bacterium RIFCSPHIGHO2_02_FULL_44_53]OGQ27958.1 MAG: hypothetical protein A3D98_06950 [Deltaproteobacteria bacterium RIFCSPHIGHO2_12_FULL_44_21]OGQ31170.1 MAG: hypothetical protein A2979_07000 [Deltaproteobacteria bacterium RIFCSPLOWO2_01_FULL_45_74]OGQ37892.1 MAG: hypothetical protein A2W61_04900 [Deltaproteobacteria bacterium 